ncbi:hypothetical protein H7H53_10085, partial [Mycobacterium lacus]|nr:hypothetical protein [Mycobacterium lacus]
MSAGSAGGASGTGRAGFAGSGRAGFAGSPGRAGVTVAAEPGSGQATNAARATGAA